MVERDICFPVESLLLATALKNVFDRVFENFSLFDPKSGDSMKFYLKSTSACKNQRVSQT